MPDFTEGTDSRGGSLDKEKRHGGTDRGGGG